MRLNVPPHIAWPLFIVVLLLSGIGGAFAVLVAARSDGGVQIVENYYEKAARWDDTAARQAASDALGWRVEARIEPFDSSKALQPVELLFTDRAGEPVSDLTGTIRAFRPQRVQAVAEIPLNDDPARPGIYRQLLPLEGEGLWDFEILARRDTTVFEARLRERFR